MSCLSEHWGLEFTPTEISRSRGRGGLLSIELELSRSCNLRCIYCYASSGIPLEDELTLEEISAVVDQAVDLGARKIIVLGGGEPFLYPHLFEVIDYILSKKVETDVFTNCTMMSEESARKLYERGVGVVVKQNSRTPAIQDLLAGREGTFVAIAEGLANLKKAGYPDADHTLGIETIICGQNYDELVDLWCWARDQGIIPYIETMTMQGRATDHPELEVSPLKIKELFEKLAQIDADRYGRVWVPHPPLVASQCARHEYSCTVTSIGDVHPCPGINLTTGNIREKSLAEVLRQSTVIQDLRNIRNTIKGECAHCAFKPNCYGCRGHAYQVAGDYLAEDPLCWLKAGDIKD